MTSEANLKMVDDYATRGVSFGFSHKIPDSVRWSISWWTKSKIEVRSIPNVRRDFDPRESKKIASEVSHATSLVSVLASRSFL